MSETPKSQSAEPTRQEFDTSEQALANLISELADAAARGEEPVLEEVCEQYPHFESDLRELWGTVVVTNAAGRHQRSRQIGSSQSGIAQTFDLPCEFGEYILESELGRGGMGVVYQAIRKADRQPVAIKMILQGDFATPADRQRFDSEALAASKLDHPNIIPIYEIGEINGRAFFCMKLISGLNLSQRLLKGPLATEQAAEIMKAISQAIEHAHSQGVLHRDLKPSNILIDEDGQAYVADFGLAKQAKNPTLTRSGAVLGTPSYMAPEQAAGVRGQVDTSSDIYSLGAILYHMLTGHPPFLGASPVDTVMMVIEQDPVAPRVLNRNADRSLEMICMRCLQKPKDLRYNSAGDLAADFDAVLRDESVSARFGRFGQVIGSVFRDTHHAVILENWGLLWIWHSLVLLVASLATEGLFLLDVKDPFPFWLMWTFGLGTWAVVFWVIRRRMGPVTFVERQIAHVWAASMCAVALVFPIEILLGLEILQLSPLLGILAGMVFLIKAGMLSGSFYIHAVIMFVTAIVMAAVGDNYAMAIFGVVSAGCFFTAHSVFCMRLPPPEPRINGTDRFANVVRRHRETDPLGAQRTPRRPPRGRHRKTDDKRRDVGTNCRTW